MSLKPRLYPYVKIRAALYLGVVIIFIAVLFYSLLLHPHPAAAQQYPIQGDFKDQKFQQYWLQAREHGLTVGAYHFYRLCRSGEIQAQNFIATVPNKTDALPPVIDLEYDAQCINTFTKEQLLKEIQLMHDRLYQHYGKQPIFYISKAFYNIILAGQFSKTPLWVREYQGKPQLKNNPKWLFWQHTNQGEIKGIVKSVDLNVFNGDTADWNRFLHKNGLQPLKNTAQPKPR